MCRISAIIGTPQHKPELMHLMMLYGSAERFQHDGWGITDGALVRVSGDPFYREGAISRHFDTEKIWLGHVRSASVGTALGDEAAHPYFFPFTDHSFAAVHNGHIDELFKVRVNGAPNTDSYRAFSALDHILYKQRIPRKHVATSLVNGVFAEWIGDYGKNTTFAFGLHLDDRLILIRDSTKELWIARNKECTLVHTSRDALDNVLDFAHIYFAITFSAPYLLDNNMLVEFTSDNRLITCASLEYAFAQQPVPVQKKRKKGR